MTTTGDVLAEGACERCGSALILIDLLATAKRFAGLNPAAGNEGPGPEWCEVHRRDEPDGSMRMGFRQHTPERCTRQRDGEPEPYEFADEDDDDWDDV